MAGRPAVAAAGPAACGAEPAKPPVRWPGAGRPARAAPAGPSPPRWPGPAPGRAAPCARGRQTGPAPAADCRQGRRRCRPCQSRPRRSNRCSPSIDRRRREVTSRCSHGSRESSVASRAGSGPCTCSTLSSTTSRRCSARVSTRRCSRSGPRCWKCSARACSTWSGPWQSAKAMKATCAKPSELRRCVGAAARRFHSQPRLAAATGPAQGDQAFLQHQARSWAMLASAPNSRVQYRGRPFDGGCRRTVPGPIAWQRGDGGQPLGQRRQAQPLVVDPFVVATGQQVAAVPAAGCLGVAGAQGLLEAQHVAVDAVGLQPHRVAVGHHQRAAGFVLDRRLQGGQRVAQPVAARSRRCVGPQQVNQFLARVAALRRQGQAGQQQLDRTPWQPVQLALAATQRKTAQQVQRPMPARGSKCLAREGAERRRCLQAILRAPPCVWRGVSRPGLRPSSRPARPDGPPRGRGRRPGWPGSRCPGPRSRPSW